MDVTMTPPEGGDDFNVDDFFSDWNDGSNGDNNPPQPDSGQPDQQPQQPAQLQQPTQPDGSQDIRQMQEELRVLKQRDEDLRKFFTGDQGQQQPQIAGYTAEQLQTLMITDPIKYHQITEENVANRIMSQMAQQQQNQQLIDYYRQQNPDLGPYEDYVSVEIQRVIDQAKQQGKQIQPNEAMEQGIAQFRQRMGMTGNQANPQNNGFPMNPFGSPQQAVNPLPQQQPQSRDVRTLSMDMGINGPSQPQNRQVNPMQMTNQQWEEFSRQFTQL